MQGGALDLCTLTITTIKLKKPLLQRENVGVRGRNKLFSSIYFPLTLWRWLDLMAVE